MCMYVCTTFHSKWNAFGCSVCERSAGMRGALPGNRWWASRELVGQDWRADQHVQSCKTTWLWSNVWGLLQTTGRNLVFGVLGLRRNLLTQVIKELMGKMLCCTWYIQIRKNWSEMWRAGASLAACSEHEVAELRILREGSKANSRMTTLNIRRTDFDLFRNLLRKIPWNTILKRRGV